MISANDHLKDERATIEKFIETFANMNYKNFSIVHMDSSSDGRVMTLMKEYVSQKYPELLNKLSILR